MAAAGKRGLSGWSLFGATFWELPTLWKGRNIGACRVFGWSFMLLGFWESKTLDLHAALKYVTSEALRMPGGHHCLNNAADDEFA